MTKEELANKLATSGKDCGSDFCNFPPKHLVDRAKKNGLVIVYGLTQFDGAIQDFDFNRSGDFFFTKKGILKNECHYECPNHKKMGERLKNKIRVEYCKKEREWTFDTHIPHAPFKGGLQRGIVFSMNDLK